MPLWTRLAAYVAATVLLPLVAVTVVVLAVADLDREDLLLQRGVVGACVAAVLAYAAIHVAYRRVLEAVEKLAERARGVTVGHLGRDAVPIAGPPELTRLGRTFDEMIQAVRSFMDERDHSEGQFRRSVERLGVALSGSHDEAAIAEVTTETARLLTGCRTAVLWQLDEARLTARATQGEARVRSTVALGEGLAGRAAAAGAPRFGEDRAVAEPHHEHAMAAPIVVGDRVWGVLATYGRSATTIPYSIDDVASLAHLARQAETALDNARLHAEATRLSITDPLTGLANRRELGRRLDLELARASRAGEPLSLVILDVDDFKAVNDTYGHPAGDAVLEEVARRLRAIGRRSDLAARLGGEEFALLLPGAGVELGATAATRLRRALGGEPVDATGAVVSITCSAGLATYPDHGATAEELLSGADAALYRAKAAGKDRVERAIPPERTREDAAR